MPEYRIRPCLLADLRIMAREMRDDDRSEIIGLGCLPRHALFQCWRDSPSPMVAEIDDGKGWQCAAVFGDTGSVLQGRGVAWLFTASTIERMPLSFLRETIRYVAEQLKVRRELTSLVRADYVVALRFFTLVGFCVEAPVAMPPNGVEYCRIWARA